MQLLGLCLEFLEAPFGVDEDGIFGDVAKIESLLELLWCSRDTLCEAFDRHPDPAPPASNTTGSVQYALGMTGMV